MTTINCIIVDDEPIARDLLTNYISQVPYLRLAGACSNAFEAMQLLNKKDVELIILDINMPRLSGFEMLRSLKQYPSVIITSAYPEYALEGFELSVIDYLLKPFSFQRFVQATEKVIKHGQEPVLPIIEDAGQHFLMVRSDKKLTKVYFSDITYVEAYGNYIYIHSGQDKIISKQTLTQFEEQLPAGKFIRIHKSFVVAVNAVKYLEGNQVSLGDTRLPIGKVYREGVLKRFQ
ncbi:MAG TPA: LytTR family DNA-binding domain-containing protein [Chitinophaga sp.]|uniref:LytR/AlgR family response regulator transcription factor n=1 Tax=Chitinophaga sp. TaxID=1869181 RepID=UPI002F954901